MSIVLLFRWASFLTRKLKFLCPLMFLAIALIRLILAGQMHAEQSDYGCF